MQRAAPEEAALVPGGLWNVYHGESVELFRQKSVEAERKKAEVAAKIQDLVSRLNQGDARIVLDLKTKYEEREKVVELMSAEIIRLREEKQTLAAECEMYAATCDALIGPEAGRLLAVSLCAWTAGRDVNVPDVRPLHDTHI